MATLTAYKHNELQKIQIHQRYHPATITIYIFGTKVINICKVFIIISGIHTADTMSCSSSNQTVGRVNRCPRNQLEWNIRAEQFNCSSFSQSCVDTSMFLYHCALNAEVTELLEMCAPLKFIHGQKCVEYNIIGSIIQESTINCSNSNVPCPEAYKSTEAFKYQSCYDAVKFSGKKPNATLNATLDYSTFKPKNSTSDAQNSDSIFFILIIAVLILVLIFTITLSVYLFIALRKQQTTSRHDSTTKDHFDSTPRGIRLDTAESANNAAIEMKYLLEWSEKNGASKHTRYKEETHRKLSLP